MRDVVDVELVKLQWGVEIALYSERCLPQAHFMASVGAKAVDLTLGCEGKRVSMATADLHDRVKHILHSCWLLNDQLAAEYSVAQAELTLAIIAESVKLACACEQG